MKALVVYYSRSGNTKLAGEAIARALACESEEILDKKDRSGVIGWIFAGKDAQAGNWTEIAEPKKKPPDYGLVVVGTPIWAGNVTPAIRTYLDRFKGKFRKIAFFCTCGGPIEKTFSEMKKTCGKTPLATLELREFEVKGGGLEAKVREFAGKLK